MPMYERRSKLERSRELDQGDILRLLLYPKPPSGRNLALLRNKNKMDFPAPPSALSPLDGELRAVWQLELIDAIVLSNSCDNTGDVPILFAPIRPFEFADGTVSEADQWLDISEAATGTASPKLFYLPEAAAFDLPRSEAQIGKLFALQHDWINRSIKEAKTERVCGLTPEAQRHLQWAIGLLFSRDARDDHAWPSDEDLRLKMAWLKEKIPSAGNRAEDYKSELKALEQRFALPVPTTEPPPS